MSSVQDVQVVNPPTDSISCLAFSSQADHLAVASWDNTVRMYEVGANGRTQTRGAYTHQAPALSVCWSKDGTKIFSGGADYAGYMFDAATGSTHQVAQHDAPIKAVKWIDAPQGGILATGSWDKTIKYWDLRAPRPVATIQLPERCYAMDALYPVLVVGTAERHVQIYDLTNPTVAFKTIQSPLMWQTRVISCFRSSSSMANGFAIGSIEGRVAFQYVDEKDAAKNYSFRCHRHDLTTSATPAFPPSAAATAATASAKPHSHIYAINDISFHPTYAAAAFSTCGSDGWHHFWDGEARARVRSFGPQLAPVTATAFSRTGAMFAYAVSDDWSGGYSGFAARAGAGAGEVKPKVMLHACTDEDVRRRPVRK